MADVISVSALNAYVKTLLERDYVLTDVAIRGEISNFTRHFKTGHCYFTIKDETCSVKAVMFRGNASRLNFEPENGISVIIRGQITLYEQQGTFQINADTMFLDGVGAIQAAFEKLKDKLEQQGLFDEQHKKQLPEIPRCVGLVTSKTGAALQDILNVAKRRNPNAHFLLYSAKVQGDDAKHDIIAGIKELDSIEECDVIIVARGGGSKEDLWVFNSEEIARAAFACKTPIVSAIGHEIDFSILDFVADMRAPTPSAAAEIVIPDMENELERLNIIFDNIRNIVLNYADMCYNNLNMHMNFPRFKQIAEYPLEQVKYIETLQAGICRSAKQKVKYAKREMVHFATLGESLNPYGVLARGYSIVKKQGAVVKNALDVEINDEITVNLHSGKLHCNVIKRTVENSAKRENDI